MFKRLGTAYRVVVDSGAVEAITRGPHGFLQVMAFCWFLATVFVFWYPPDALVEVAGEMPSTVLIACLSAAFMICSIAHVIMLLATKTRDPSAQAIDDVEANQVSDETTTTSTTEG